MLEALRRSGLGAILVALACLYFSAAHAQSSGSATGGSGRAATSLSQGNPKSTATQPARPPAPGDATALTYTPDPHVSQKIRASMIELASATNPASRPEWERTMADDAVLRDFDKLMAAQGYSRLNFADAIAMLLSVCWEIANDRTANAAQIRGAHDQARNVALHTPTLRGLQNAERQTLVETIAYQVSFLYSAKLSAERTGNRPQLAEVRESATKAAQQYGIDVWRMTLTERGFQRL
jgi:hypothetical protein